MAFVWDNYGPLHVDRCEAVSQTIIANVVGLELNERSNTYDWIPPPAKNFKKVTLGASGRSLSSYLSILRAILVEKPSATFLCHYDRIDIFLVALTLNAFGHKCFTMLDSKFDDYERHFWRELGKRLFLAPYQGALVASERSKDYVRFLGINRDRIALGYDTANLERIRQSASHHEETPFRDRSFLVVARLVAKKDIFSAIAAYRLYREKGGEPRGLIICGSGPLEQELKASSDATGYGGEISFTGFLQSEAIASMMRNALVLVLPSTEEQFGQVVVEALALGLPVILSTPCGARDELVRTGVNGFIFEPGNREGLAQLFHFISKDENLWQSMSSNARLFSEFGSAARFADAVVTLSREVGVILRRREGDIQK